MSFSRQKFGQLADKLLGQVSGDARRTVTFIKKSGFNYSTQSFSETQFIVDNAVVVSYDDRAFELENIKVGDVKIIARFSDEFLVTPDNTECVVDGISYSIINSKSDPLKVIWTIQARAK